MVVGTALCAYTPTARSYIDLSSVHFASDNQEKFQTHNPSRKSDIRCYGQRHRTKGTLSPEPNDTNRKALIPVSLDQQGRRSPIGKSIVVAGSSGGERGERRHSSPTCLKCGSDFGAPNPPGARVPGLTARCLGFTRPLREDHRR